MWCICRVPRTANTPEGTVMYSSRTKPNPKGWSLGDSTLALWGVPNAQETSPWQCHSPGARNGPYSSLRLLIRSHCHLSAFLAWNWHKFLGILTGSAECASFYKANRETKKPQNMAESSNGNMALWSLHILQESLVFNLASRWQPSFLLHTGWSVTKILHRKWHHFGRQLWDQISNIP